LRLTTAIKNSALQKTTLLIDLYERSGHCRNMLVSCSPFLDRTGAPVGCRICIEPSCALPHSETLNDAPFPKALVSPDYPYPLQLVNARFERAFGLAAAQQLLGNPLNTISPIDSSQLRALAQSAAAGRSRTAPSASAPPRARIRRRRHLRPRRAPRKRRRARPR
jgi:hypothetical protein